MGTTLSSGRPSDTRTGPQEDVLTGLGSGWPECGPCTLTGSADGSQLPGQGIGDPTKAQDQGA